MAAAHRLVRLNRAVQHAIGDNAAGAGTDEGARLDAGTGGNDAENEGAVVSERDAEGRWRAQSPWRRSREEMERNAKESTSVN